MEIAGSHIYKKRKEKKKAEGGFRNILTNGTARKVIRKPRYYSYVLCWSLLSHAGHLNERSTSAYT